MVTKKTNRRPSVDDIQSEVPEIVSDVRGILDSLECLNCCETLADVGQNIADALESAERVLESLQELNLRFEGE